MQNHVLTVTERSSQLLTTEKVLIREREDLSSWPQRLAARRVGAWGYNLRSFSAPLHARPYVATAPSVRTFKVLLLLPHQTANRSVRPSPSLGLSGLQEIALGLSFSFLSQEKRLQGNNFTTASHNSTDTTKKINTACMKK